ncbi:MAG TPA: DUF72 domain-containing protein [Gaiellaceae bacterium]
MSQPRGSARPVRIGCSGWNYAHWRNDVFYPSRCAPRNWLRFYAKHFDTVEINMTFYRLPKEHIVQRWVLESPPGFAFAVKVSRYVTHIKRLMETPEHLPLLYERIRPLLRSPKLGPILWQLPPTFAVDLDRLANVLEYVQNDGYRHAFEFRHPSWFQDETYTLLREHRVALVIGDRPQVNDFQAHELTADFAFVRFHGGTHGANGNYSHAELDAWVERFALWSREVDVWAYFNNDWEGYAIENALYVKERLGQPAPADPKLRAFANAAAAQG